MKTTILSEGDFWIGGWHEAYTSYWLGYGEAVLEAEEYEYSNFYANHRFLENKSWDAWTFSPINSTETNTAPRPELLKAAPINLSKHQVSIHVHIIVVYILLNTPSFFLSTSNKYYFHLQSPVF